MKQGWEIKKLGEVATYVNGFAFKPEHWGETGIPIIRIQNLNNRNADFNYCTTEIPEKFVVEDGDILISWSASLGVYEWNRGRAYLNQHIFKVIFNKVDINKYFLKYAVNVKLNDMLKDVHGATMKHIIKRDFDNTMIPYPSCEEQEKIVAELDCLSGIIEKKKQQLKEYDALAQSIFYEMFGNPIDNEKGWEVKKLGEVVVSNMVGLTRSGKEQDLSYPYLYFKMNNIGNHGEVDWTKYTRVCASPKELEKYSLRKGDFLFNTRNSYELVGKTCIYNIEKDDVCVFNNNVMRIEFNDCINVYYIAHLFQNQYIKEQLDKIKKGTTNVWAIYFKDLTQIKILTPLYLLQQEFASKIEAIEKQKELIKQSIVETETLFNSRMDFYFS